MTDDLPKLTPHYSHKFTNTDEMKIMVLKWSTTHTYWNIKNTKIQNFTTDLLPEDLETWALKLKNATDVIRYMLEDPKWISSMMSIITAHALVKINPMQGYEERGWENMVLRTKMHGNLLSNTAFRNNVDFVTMVKVEQGTLVIQEVWT